MTARKLRIPALAIAMLGLLATAVVMPGEASAAGEPRANVVRYATISPAAFHIISPGAEYTNSGDELSLLTTAPNDAFVAPLFFEDSRVRITNLVLYAYDNGPGTICLGMHRTTPADLDFDSQDPIGSVCSDGAAAGVRAFEVASVSNPFVYGSHGPYLYVGLPGTYAEGYIFYGARVTYLYEP